MCVQLYHTSVVVWALQVFYLEIIHIGWVVLSALDTMIYVV